jgi:molybdopterin converting factor small subunit
MHIYIMLYGAARVVIGAQQIDVEFETATITLGEVLEKIISRYPRARPYLLDESGLLPPYIRVLINNIRPVPDATPATPLHDQDRVALLVAVAGGARAGCPTRNLRRE